MDTCFVVKANLVLTSKKFYVTDLDRNEQLETNVLLYEQFESGYKAYTEREDGLLIAHVVITPSKVLVEYSYDHKLFLISYRVSTKNGSPLIYIK